MAGLVEILEGIRSVKEAGVPHRDIEILFTIAEELYIKGSSVFDFSKVRAKEAYVLDISGPVGSAAYKAPSLISYQVVVTGKASTPDLIRSTAFMRSLLHPKRSRRSVRDMWMKRQPAISD